MTKANFILAIGIDHYQYISKLYNSKADVKRLIDVLEGRYGFTTICQPLYDKDATYKNIHAALAMSAEPRAEKNATLIIYFAGHGCEKPEGKGRWIPYDGTGEIADTISHEDVLAYVQMNHWAKHIILISDSCFSGTITNYKFPIQRGSTSSQKDLSSRISISAGRLEPVGDGSPGYNSPFSKTLCSFLETNTKPVITIHDVISHIRQLTPSRSYQTPQATSINCQENRHGELLLKLETYHNENRPDPLNFPDYLISGPFFPRMLKKLGQVTQGKTYLPNLTGMRLIEGVDSVNRIVVIGEAGSGKSRELIEAAKLIENEHPYLVPCFIKLGSLSIQALRKKLYNFADQYGQERSIFFLDGLDEVRPENWNQIVQAILDASKQLSHSKFVVGCRSNRYNLNIENPTISTLPNYLVLEVPNFQGEDIEKILNALQINQQDFFLQVAAQQFHDLLSHPYSLFQLTSFYQEHGNLNIARSLLNQQTLESKGVADGSETERFLQAAAFALTQAGAVSIETKALSSLGFDLSLLKGQSVFAFEKDSELWSFIHKNFQEYLSAKFLSTLTMPDIITVITEKRLEGMGINPVWFNTVSYLFGIVEEGLMQHLIDWSNATDPLSLLKFEASRLPEEMRAKVYRNIYDRYLKQDLFILSNRFTTNELGQFASNKTSLEFIINGIRDKNISRIGIINHVYVLYYVDLKEFPDEAEEIKFYLTRLLIGGQQLEPEDRLAIVRLLMQKELFDMELYEKVIEKFQNNNNAYHRTMIYEAIRSMGTADAQISYLLEGIELLENNLADHNRDETNLADEETGLFSAITSIKTVEGIEKLVEGILTEEGQHLARLCYHYRDAFIQILGVFRQKIPAHPEIVSTIIRLYLGLHKGYHSDFLEDIAQTFLQTGTTGAALMEIWIKQDFDEYDLRQLTYPLLTLDGVKDIAKAVVQEEMSEGRGRIFHQLVYNLRAEFPEYLTTFEEICAVKYDYYSLRPVEIDWADIREKQKKTTLDLLSRPDAIVTEVKTIFQQFEGDSLNNTRINELSNATFRDPQAIINPISFNLLSFVCRQLKSDITLQQVSKWLEDEKNLLFFQLTYLNSQSNISSESFSPEALDYINAAIRQFPSEDELFWLLTQKGILKKDEERLLGLTYSLPLGINNQLENPSQLEKLQNFIDPSKMKEQVYKNICSDLSYPVWLNNAAFALRSRFDNCYEQILKSMLKQERGSQQDELLQLYINATKDYEGIKLFAAQTKCITLIIASLRILSKYGQFPDFVQTHCLALLGDKDINKYEQQRLVNLLIEENHPDGLRLLTAHLAEHQAYDVRYANFSRITSLDALPHLLELLVISQNPPHNDPIFGLQNEVMRGLSSISRQSVQNGLIVKHAIEGFIDKYAGDFPNVKALRYRIEYLEEETLTANRTTQGIDQAIALVHKYREANPKNN